MVEHLKIIAEWSQEMNERYVHAIWCDDIRQEVGNKPSFMGVYTGGILVQTLPIVLPRLAVYIWANTPIERPFQKIRIRIERNDGFVLMNQPEFQDVTLPHGSDDLTRQVAMAAVLLSGAEVPTGCRYFSIFVETESETLEGPKLRINVNPKMFAENSGGFFGGVAPNVDPTDSELAQD